MLPIKYDATFCQNIKDIYGEKGKEWLDTLPMLIESICQHHSLHFIDVMPNLSYNFVALVDNLTTQETAVLKMAPTSEHIAKEAHWYECMSYQVPKLYWFDKDFHAILLERLEPGSTLKELVRRGGDDRATKIICQMIRGLQSEQHAVYPFKHISELKGSINVLRRHLNNSLFDKAYSLFQELSNDSTRDVILHGDLHHDNILAASNSWKVIDPHAYIGDPVFEVGSMIFNPCDCFPQHQTLKKIIERRLHIMADELPFDSKRIKAWAFCKTILSLAWTYEDHGKIDEGELAIAGIIDQISK